MADENKREFTEEQLRASEGHVGLQAGFNKGASQAGVGSFGNTRHMWNLPRGSPLVPIQIRLIFIRMTTTLPAASFSGLTSSLSISHFLSLSLLFSWSIEAAASVICELTTL